MKSKNKLIWIPVVALAFVFLFFGIDKFIHPEYWEGWIPLFLDGFLGLKIGQYSLIAGVSEILFGLLLLYPKTRFWGALGMVLELSFIILVVTQLDEAGIRDIGLFGMAVYILLMHKPGK